MYVQGTAKEHERMGDMNLADELANGNLDLAADVVYSALKRDGRIGVSHAGLMLREHHEQAMAELEAKLAEALIMHKASLGPWSKITVGIGQEARWTEVIWA
jgi:hypothetical protein